MPNDLANRLHINTVLVMLPYDMDKVEKLDFGFKYEAATQTYSFRDTHGQPVHYKLIADSDAELTNHADGRVDQKKNAHYSSAHDAAAFVKVDEKGKPILDAERKPQILVTFPGMNEPIAMNKEFMHSDFFQAANDTMQTTAFDRAFFDKFVNEKLTPALAHYHAKASDVDVVAHSMGNKNAFEFAARFNNSHVLSIDGWDEKDAMMGAAIRNVLRESQGKPLTQDGFRAALTEQMQELSQKTIEVGKDGSDDAHAAQHYTAKGAGHRAKDYIHKKSGDMQRSNIKVDVAGMVNEAMGERGWKSKIIDFIGMNSGNNGTEVAEAFLIQEMRTQMFSDGKLTDKEAALLNKVSAQLKESGLQMDAMQQAYSAMHALNKPQEKTKSPVR